MKQGTRAMVRATEVTMTAAKRRGQDLLDEIARKLTFIGEAFVDIGEALVELEKKKLWAALGHASFNALLIERKIMGRSQAFRLMAIARTIPRRDALLLGPDKAYAIVQYANATAAVDSVPQLLVKGVRVEGKLRDVHDVSAGEIRSEASRTRINRNSARKDPARHAALQLAKDAVRGLSRRGIRARVAVHRTKDGWEAQVTMPIAGLEMLVR
jgi:hypothetical protein